MKCGSCGNEIQPGDEFCRQCGAKVGGVLPEAAATTSPTPPMPPPPGPVTPPPPGVRSKRTSGWAVASLVFGILSWLCIPFVAAIVAVVFGGLAKRDIKRAEGPLGGSGLSTAGMILGIVNLSILIIFASIYFPWAIVNMGETRTVTRTVSLEGAETVVAEFDIHDGSLEISAGADALLEGEFTYNVDRWEPDIDYSVDDRTGELSVKQGGGWWVPILWNARSEWKIALNEDIPIDLIANLSSGDGVFHLGRLSLLDLDIDSSSGDITADVSGDKPSLRSIKIGQSSGDITLTLKGTYSSSMKLDVDNSSGNIIIDLRGEWQNNLEAEISNSSGDITLRLPQDVGVYVTADVSSGDINASGMKVRGDAYVNDPYGESEITLRLDVKTSSGDINLRPGD